MCDTKNCERDAAGTVTWLESERDYCRIHLRKARSECAELIESVSLL